MKKKGLKIFLVLLIAALVVAAAAFAGAKLFVKARGIYAGFSDKIHRISRTVEHLDEKADRLEAAVLRLDRPYAFDDSWVQNNPPFIAHAMGGVDELTYTNSLEAFEHNYALGHRVFEVDFDLTETEHMLVASHSTEDWREMTGLDENAVFSREAFKQTPLYGKYTPLDYQDVIRLMVQYPDIYVVTDTKYQDYFSVLLGFSQLVRYADSVDPTVLDRIIPQIYNEDMLSWVMDVYPFKSIIFTLYATSWTPQSVYEFCAESGVRFITMWADAVTEDIMTLWNTLGIQVGAHTCNDPAQIDALRELGVDVIYTDFVGPE